MSNVVRVFVVARKNHKNIFNKTILNCIPFRLIAETIWSKYTQKTRAATSVRRVQIIFCFMFC